MEPDTGEWKAHPQGESTVGGDVVLRVVRLVPGLTVVPGRSGRLTPVSSSGLSEVVHRGVVIVEPLHQSPSPLVASWSVPPPVPPLTRPGRVSLVPCLVRRGVVVGVTWGVPRTDHHPTPRVVPSSTLVVRLVVGVVLLRVRRVIVPVVGRLVGLRVSLRARAGS